MIPQVKEVGTQLTPRNQVIAERRTPDSSCGRAQEDDANWLAGFLLQRREALLWIVRQGLEPEMAARKFGASLAMFHYRLNVTGVKQQVSSKRLAGKPPTIDVGTEFVSRMSPRPRSIRADVRGFERTIFLLLTPAQSVA